MIRRALAAGFLSAVVGSAALAQGTVPGIPDVPSGPARLHGRVVLAGKPEKSAPGVPIVLYAISPSSPPGLRGSVADDEGRFAFDGISNDPSIAYLVAARYAEVPFGERVTFTPGQESREVRLEISDPIPDSAAVTGGESTIRLDAGCTGVHVTESHELRNPGKQVVFVPDSERQARPPILSIALPADADGFSAAIVGLSEGVTLDGDTVKFYGPLYPGSQTVEFGYDLPAPKGRVVLDRVVRPGVDGIVVMTPSDAPPAEGERLGAARPVELDGREYIARATRAIAAGDHFAAESSIPLRDTDRVALEEARFWLELDAAALVVDEEYVLQVSGDEPVTSTGSGPVLCLPLPAGAEGLRLSPTALKLGPTPDTGGGLALRGPIPPGPTSIALRYRLPVEGDTILFERRVSRPLPLLSVFVADNGVRLESERLHGRRPFRTTDRLYMQVEGFQIDPEESVALRLTRLDRRPPQRAAAAGVLLVAAAAAVGFLFAPLRRGPSAEYAYDAAESPVALERDAVYEAIRDLDHDFETGKVAADDHARMRAELRARAVALLSAERAARQSAPAAPAPTASPRPPAATPPPPTVVRFCPSCGARVEPAWRFCASCGQAVPTLEADPRG